MAFISGCLGNSNDGRNEIVEENDLKREFDYYKSGEIKSEKWLNGDKIDGKLIFYFESGDTMEIQTWSDGVKNGPAAKYYQNGRLKYLANYGNNRLKGEAISYRKDGSILYKQFYDDDGGIKYEYHYDQEGQILNAQPFLILLPDTDTLNFNQKNRIEVRFVNVDSLYDVGIDLGMIKENKNGHIELTDTIDIIETKNDQFFMIINPKNTGTYSISGLWYYTDNSFRSGSNVDTISTTTFNQVDFTFYVK